MCAVVSGLGSVAMLVHVFVMLRFDYCNILLAGTPKATTDTDKLLNILNMAAYLVNDTEKFHHGLSQLMYVNLHWLNAPEQGKYKFTSMVHL